MNSLSLAAPMISELLDNIVSASGLELSFSIMQHPDSIPEITVEFSGPDTAFLTARNGELLHAMEHLVAKVSGLEADQHDLLSLDADHFKKRRDHHLKEQARLAAVRVAETGRSFTFAPMSSHERRLLHLAFTTMGLHTASVGEGHLRAVVLHPAGSKPSNGSHSQAHSAERNGK